MEFGRAWLLHTIHESSELELLLVEDFRSGGFCKQIKWKIDEIQSDFKKRKDKH